MESTLIEHDAALAAPAAERSMYADGTYLRNNPDWHTSDSPWKARHIQAMLERNGLTPPTICEVGCGAGDVLVNLAGLMPAGTQFFGYDISPDAYRICSAKSAPNLTYRLDDLLEAPVRFDLAMAIDVFEHVEDYFSFLRKLRGKARYKLFHIPLDLSVLNLLRPSPLIHLWRTVGHVHQFSKDTALAALE